MLSTKLQKFVLATSKFFSFSIKYSQHLHYFCLSFPYVEQKAKKYREESNNIFYLDLAISGKTSDKRG